VVVVPETESIYDALGNIITEKLQKFVEKITPKEKVYAPWMQYADSIVLPAGGFGVVRIPGPTRGRFWYMRKLRVSGVSPTAVSSNSETLFSGAAPGPTVNLPSGFLQSVSFIFNTDAVVANRTVTVLIRDANNRVLYQFASPFNQTASLSTEYSLSPGTPSTANGNPVIVTGPLPNIFIPPGSQLILGAQSIDAGDTFSQGVVIMTGTARADVFVCPQDLRTIGSLAQCPIASWKDQLITVPQVQSYGHGEMRIQPQEMINVAITGAVGSQFVVSAEAFEFPDSMNDVEWIV